MQSYANLKITLQLNCIARHIQFCVQSFFNKTLQKLSSKTELSHFKPVNRHAKIFATVYLNQFLNWFNWLAEYLCINKQLRWGTATGKLSCISKRFTAEWLWRIFCTDLLVPGNLYQYKCWEREEALDKLALGKERQLLMPQSTEVPPLLERNRTIQLGLTKLCYRGMSGHGHDPPHIPKKQLNTQP